VSGKPWQEQKLATMDQCCWFGSENV